MLSGFGFRVLSFGFRVLGFGFRFRVSGLGFRAEAATRMLCGSACDA